MDVLLYHCGSCPSLSQYICLGHFSASQQTTLPEHIDLHPNRPLSNTCSHTHARAHTHTHTHPGGRLWPQHSQRPRPINPRTVSPGVSVQTGILSCRCVLLSIWTFESRMSGAAFWWLTHALPHVSVAGMQCLVCPCPTFPTQPSPQPGGNAHHLCETNSCFCQ